MSETAYEYLAKRFPVGPGAAIIAILEPDGFNMVLPVTGELLDDPGMDDVVGAALVELLPTRRLRKGTGPEDGARADLIAGSEYAEQNGGGGLVEAEGEGRADD